MTPQRPFDLGSDIHWMRSFRAQGLPSNTEHYAHRVNAGLDAGLAIPPGESVEGLRREVSTTLNPHSPDTVWVLTSHDWDGDLVIAVVAWEPTEAAKDHFVDEFVIAAIKADGIRHDPEVSAEEWKRWEAEVRENLDCRKVTYHH